MKVSMSETESYCKRTISLSLYIPHGISLAPALNLKPQRKPRAAAHAQFKMPQACVYTIVELQKRARELMDERNTPYI